MTTVQRVVLAWLVSKGLSGPVAETIVQSLGAWTLQEIAAEVYLMGLPSSDDTLAPTHAGPDEQ